MDESDPFNWAGAVLGPDSDRASLGSSASNSLLSSKESGSGILTEATAWYQELWVFFRLGFRHIFPEGTDHILFVLGLFFLGITWRKLL